MSAEISLRRVEGGYIVHVGEVAIPETHVQDDRRAASSVMQDEVIPEITRLRAENERLQERLTDADRLRRAFANCEDVNERLRARVEELEKMIDDAASWVGAWPRRAITSQEEDDG